MAISTNSQKVLIGVLVVVLVIGAAFFATRPSSPEETAQEQSSEEGEVMIPPIPLQEVEREAISTIADTAGEGQVLSAPQACQARGNEGISGTMHLSLVPDTEDEEEKISGYTLDVESGKLEKSLERECHSFAASFSSDGQSMAFASQCEDEFFHIFRADAGGQNAEQVTKSETQNLRTAPAISPDGELVAFTSIPPVSDVLAEEAEVRLVDSQGNEQVVTVGANAVFSPQGHLLVIKNAGIHLFDFEKQEERRVIQVHKEDEGLVVGKVNQMISLSQDGSQLAWTDVEREKVYLFHILSWEPFRYETMAVLDTPAFWPAFSPDGTYIAVQELDIDEEQQVASNQRIGVYDLCNGASEETSFDLTAYFPGAMWLNAWME